ncbi:MAG: hypothetical protein KF689_02730 [Gemmatimonadaceae bacterium]|nr:hypothetical protein [Gemmatimonadaceae bacterium]MCW5827646.1 hypothetical protein [Gemmatimonadaceae bacterium]
MRPRFLLLGALLATAGCVGPFAPERVTLEGEVADIQYDGDKVSDVIIGGTPEGSIWVRASDRVPVIVRDRTSLGTVRGSIAILELGERVQLNYNPKFGIRLSNPAQYPVTSIVVQR